MFEKRKSDMGKVFIKRKTYVIDKKFQFRFVATFLLYIAISLVIFTIGVGLYYWISYMAGENIFTEFIIMYRQVEQLDEEGKALIDENGKVITTTEPLPPVNRIQIVFPAVLINNLIIMVIISVLGIFYSHKIAGPVYRMDVEISKVLAGEKGIRIKLRRNDKLRSLAEKINRLIEKFEGS
jgi:methyl-accepting chemotaxis protein